MNSDPWGPGLGSILAQQRDQVDANDAAYQQELARMRRELQAKIAGGQHNDAMARAAADLAAEIVAENAAVESGRLSTRRLSDPANAEARNAEFARKTASNLTRLSGGKIRPTLDDQAILKAQKRIR
ncbi:hypothetical protein ABIC83_002618 [Roseateles asaccharophilus]|uniref:hypothetical protein n=1 Tax=Roseateles asaccharophilus TaxID=582607 RepID=UPI003836DFCA